MKNIAKYIGFVVVGLVAIFFFLANFSAVESSFKCTGEASSESGGQPLTIYLKLTDYRPWVGLWSDSDASMNLEIPNELVEYYGQVEEVGDQLQIYETYPSKSLKGNFSTLSKTLAVDLSPVGFFDGSCVTN